MIFWVPTPLAIPAQRRSTSRMMLQRSAHAWLMMVIWAPKNKECIVQVLLNVQISWNHGKKLVAIKKRTLIKVQ